MADNSENIEGIKKDVGVIRKSFGAKAKSNVQVPSGGEWKEDEELDLLEILLTGMSSALFGIKANTPNGWATIFSKPEQSLQSLIKSIKENIDNIIDTHNTSIKSTIVDISDETIAKLRMALSTNNQNTNVNNGNDSTLKEILNEIKSFKDDGFNVSFNNLDNIKDELKFNEANFKELNKLIQKGDFKKLIASIGGLEIKSDVRNLNAITNFLSTLARILSLEKFDSDNIKTINNILSKDINGKLLPIINSLSISEETNNKLVLLQKVIENINKIRLLSFIKLVGKAINIEIYLDIINTFHKITNIINNIDYKRTQSKIKAFTNALEKFNDLNSTLDHSILKESTLICYTAINDVMLLRLLLFGLKGVDKIKPITFNNLSDTIENLDEIFTRLNSNYEEESKKLVALSSILTSLTTTFQNLESLMSLGNNVDKYKSLIEENICDLLTVFQEDSALSESLKSLLIIEDDKLKQINNIVEVIKKLSDLSKIIIAAKFAEAGFEALEKGADSIYNIINKFSKIKQEDIDKLQDAISTIMTVIVASGAILLLGGAIMKFINIGDLLAFTLALSLFVGSIFFILNKFQPQAKDISKGTEDIMKVVAISGAILVLGSLFMHLIDFEDLLGFTLALGAFVAGIMFVYTLSSRFADKSIDSAKEFGYLVMISAGVLILGSMAYHFIPIKDVLGFAKNLSLFLLAISGVYIGLSFFIKNSITGAKEFTHLLVISAGLMILGGIIGDWVGDNFGKIMKFGGTLALFTALVCIPFILGSMLFGKAMESAKSFGKLLIISAGLLIFGPKLVDLVGIGNNYSDKLLNSIYFGLVLSGFVLIVCGAMALAGLNKKAMSSAIAFSLIVSIAAAALLIGPYMIAHNKVKWDDIYNFGKGLIVFTGLMGLVIFGLGQIPTMALLKGTVALVIIGAIAYGAAWVIKEMYNNFTGINWDVLYEGLEHAGKIFGIFGAVIGVLGALVYGTGGVALLIAAGGAAVLATIEGIAWGAAKVIQAIAVGMMSLHKAKKELGNEKQVTEAVDTVIDGFIKVITKVYNGLDTKHLVFMRAAAPAIRETSVMLSAIALAVQTWAMLKIPTGFDKDGKPTGYTTINNTSFNQAYNNIYNTLLALFRPIVEAVKKNPDMFKGALGGLGKTPIMNAVLAFSKTGQMLSNIATGIQDWAMLKIPTEYDEKGKPKGYTTFDKANLQLMSHNIEWILTAIGNSINNVVTNPDYSRLFLFGEDSPALIASRAINEASKSIKNIVEIIKSFTDQKFTAMVDKFNDPNAGVQANLNKMLKGIISILNIFLEPQEGSRGAFGKWFLGEKTFAENLNDNKDEIEESVNSVKTFCASIESIYNSISSLGNKLGKNKEGLALVSNGEFMQNVKSALASLIDFTGTILGVNKNDINRLNRNKNQFAIFENFANVLDSFINSIIKYDTNANTNLMLLAQGIMFLYLSTQNIQNTLQYKNFVDDTGDFVEHINAIDLNKMNTMQSLINSMIALSDKMGSLDKFAEVFSERITNVLAELILQLRKAEATINNAHELQEHRKRLINNSIGEIKKIMGQHMVVEVYKKKDESELQLKTPGGFANDIDKNNLPGTSSESSTPSSISTSPEDTVLKGNETNTNPPQYLANNDDELLNRIKNLLKNNIKDWGNV